MPAQFLAPPITVVFLWGVFWRRGTKEAAIITLVLGFVLGFIVFLIDLPAFGDTQWISDPGRGLGIPFMLQAAWGFAIWSVVYVIVSYLTPPPTEQQVSATTWANPRAILFDTPLVDWSDPRILSALLFAAMAALYWVFR